MNTREEILQRIETDLEKFRVQYGYELDYTNIVKGIIPISDCKNFPTVCFDIGSDASAIGGEANYQQLKTSRIIFVVYVSDFKEKGKIINIREQAISDMNKFVMQDISVTGYETADWKVLRLDNVEGVQGWDIQADHSTNYGEGLATIEITVNVTYYDFHMQINNFQFID